MKKENEPSKEFTDANKWYDRGVKEGEKSTKTQTFSLNDVPGTVPISFQKDYLEGLKDGHAERYRESTRKTQKESIITIQEEVTVGNVILEKGDKIRVLKEGKFGVFMKGGSIGGKKDDKPSATYDSKEEADAKAKRMNAILSPGEKGYYGMKYYVKQIEESVEKGDKIRVLEQKLNEKALVTITPDLKFETEFILIKNPAGNLVDGMSISLNGKFIVGGDTRPGFGNKVIDKIADCFYDIIDGKF